MNTREWLESRRLGLGGSDIPAIMMESPKWTSEWSLFLSKVHGVDEERSDAAMMTGNVLEEAVIKYAVAKTGSEGFEVGVPVIHPSRVVMRASPDAYLLGHPEFGRVGIEAKVVEWPSDEPLEDHVWQCRWYCAVTDSPRWILASFARKAPAWQIQVIERDLDIEADMIERCHAWWERHVVGGEPPDIDGSRAAAVGLANHHGVPSDADDYRVADEAEIRMMRSYNDLDTTIRRLEVERGRVANRIRHAIAGDGGIRFTGGRARWHRSGKNTHAGRLTVRIDEF